MIIASKRHKYFENNLNMKQKTTTLKLTTRTIRHKHLFIWEKKKTDNAKNDGNIIDQPISTRARK